ncbi:MAG: hypothetical protein FJ148_10710 [Deltaproteobacteria bacterium]|nr:hypothetical protein [Deltaproteobacteria bacterium]
MYRRLAPLSILLSLLSCLPARAEQDVIVMVGESTTYGQTEASTQSPVNAAVVLEFLLSKIDYPCPYANLPVRNWAVPGTNTTDWFVKVPHVYCAIVAIDPSGFESQLVRYACEHQTPLAPAVLPVAKVRGEHVKLLLVNAQGTNDAHIAPHVTPDKTVERIASWPSIVAPVPVLISPPFYRNDDPNTLVVRMAGHSPEALARYVRKVRRLELARGVITGPDRGVLFANPPFQSDGFHLTDGGSAIAAAHWLDKLCPRPIPPPLMLPPRSTAAVENKAGG